MDLNPFPPADWTLEDGPYEVADYCQFQNTDLLVLLNAWLDPDPGVDEEGPSWSTLQYWVARLRPLWFGEQEEGSITQVETDKTTTVVVCNRTGEENGELMELLSMFVNTNNVKFVGDTFAGSSAVFQMNRTLGKPRLLDMMGKREEGIRVWTTRVTLPTTP